MYKHEDLRDEETQVFNIEFEKFIYNNYPSLVARFLDEHKKKILELMPFVKGHSEKEFRGVFPGAGQLGWSFPQPQFFDIKSWINEYKELGWQTLVDSSLEYSCMILFGFYNMVKPKESHLVMEICGRTFPVLWLNELKDLHIYELACPILAMSNFKVKVNISEIGTDELTPLGIYFGDYYQISKKDVAVK